MATKLSGFTARDFVALEVLPTCLTHDYGNDWGKAGKDHIPYAVKRAFRVADEFMAQREKTDD